MGDLPAKVSWYMRWRTTIWGAVWFVVGVFGGNADRLVQSVPTLQYDQTEIEYKSNDIEDKMKRIKENLDKIQKELDKV